MAENTPYNREAEEYLLGTTLYNYKKVKAFTDKLAPKLFYIKQNRFIAKSILELHREGHKVDIITVQENLESKNLLEDAGGYEKLANLRNESFAIENFSEHLSILKDNYERRKLINLFSETTNELSNKKDLDSVKNKVSTSLFNLNSKQTAVSKGGFAKFEENSIKEKINRIKVGSGISILDHDLAKGFAPQNISIITARPRMGKSAVKQNIILNQAMRGIGILDLSLEMTAEEELDRIISMDSGIPLYDILNIRDWVKIKDRKFVTQYPEKLRLIKETAQKLDNLDLYIEDGMMSLSEARATMIRYKELYDVEIVYVDLVDRIKEVYRASSNKAQKITSVVGSFAEIASNYNMHVCCLVQQRRRNKKKEKPSLEGLKGSGSYEEFADLILGVYREFVDDDELLEDDVIDIYLRKQRMGKTGKYTLSWESETLKILEQDGIYE
ncbi:MAG: hypothetical protein K9K32_00180 [Halanaerobiales bacterium]|nr:hypothetical protein [Halanaerobiales bacterium]